MTADVVRPPIPEDMAQLPTQGGLAVPVVILRLADGGFDFRVNHRRKVVECFVHRLCGVCGRHLGRPVVFFATREAVERGVYGEPAMHPWCAAYSQQACPIVAGRVKPSEQLPASRGKRGERCPDPGCDCAGMVPYGDDDDDSDARRERLAGPWFAVWVDDYRIAVSQRDGQPFGAALDQPPLRIRQVSGDRVDVVPGYITGQTVGAS